MRDLKHLIFFENLLQEANNDLVKQAKNEGKRALGYTCYFMPEVLLDLPGCFSVRLRAPRCTSPEIATYYMSSRTCHYGRSLMERALEGGFNFLDAQMATETCTVTCRFQEHLKQMDIIQNPDFFCEFTDVPFKKNENSMAHYRKQLRAHVLDPLRDKFGIDTSDEAILAAIEEHNEVCRLITEIGNYRKLDNPPITGYEFHVIQLVSLTCPKYLILPYLRETAEELKTREPESKFPYRIRVALAGAENDDPGFTQLIESCGAMVVADRYCYGSIPGREEIRVAEGQDRLAYARMALALPPKGPAGTTYEYANNGYVVLGAIIERRLDKTWEAAIRERLFEPLKLGSAGFGAPDREGPGQPSGHTAAADGVLRAFPASGPSDNPAVLGPAGRVHMTLQDLVLYLAAHRDQSPLLTPDTWRTLHTPPFGGDYAMGWMVQPNGVLWHNGSNTLWYAMAAFHPGQGVASAAAANDGRMASVAPAVELAVHDAILSAKA